MEKQGAPSLPAWLGQAQTMGGLLQNSSPWSTQGGGGTSHPLLLLPWDPAPQKSRRTPTPPPVADPWTTSHNHVGHRAGAHMVLQAWASHITDLGPVSDKGAAAAAAHPTISTSLSLLFALLRFKDSWWRSGVWEMKFN